MCTRKFHKRYSSSNCIRIWDCVLCWVSKSNSLMVEMASFWVDWSGCRTLFQYGVWCVASNFDSQLMYLESEVEKKEKMSIRIPWTFNELAENTLFGHGGHKLWWMMNFHFECLLFKQVGRNYPVLTLGENSMKWEYILKSVLAVDANWHFMLSFAFGVKFRIWGCFGATGPCRICKVDSFYPVFRISCNCHPKVEFWRFSRLSWLFFVQDFRGCIFFTHRGGDSSSLFLMRFSSFVGFIIICWL